MVQRTSPALRNQTPTLVLLLIILAIALWYFLSGAAGQVASGVPEVNLASGLVLLVVGFAAGVLGGLIGTGGCSLMLPVIHFWMGYPAPIAVGTTLFAVIFTAISGGYGHLVRGNVDRRAVTWVGGAGIVGVLLGSWLFTLLVDQSQILGLILGVVFLLYVAVKFITAFFGIKIW